MTREELIEFAKYLDEGCDLLSEGYIESRTDEYLQKVANKNFVLADVSGRSELLRSFIDFVLKNNYLIKESTANDVIIEFERNYH